MPIDHTPHVLEMTGWSRVVSTLTRLRDSRMKAQFWKRGREGVHRGSVKECETCEKKEGKEKRASDTRTPDDDV
ncbi:hypothetical protein M3A49_12340 [Paraburkholderia sp. CNPSo 3076]|uniref:hypothetical protein n=1 Tax=Paraburkholderia sp. CNPSo 3076 TaxID=2940936 RepID=UPI00225A977E|nr:hypothetical protein [Paraburkholderia sp. CNPSo 3076]MCX5540276.1 hypothetical protein [Paraburkholderia sp. CNPSo 3076]